MPVVAVFPTLFTERARSSDTVYSKSHCVQPSEILPPIFEAGRARWRFSSQARVISSQYPGVCV